MKLSKISINSSTTSNSAFTNSQSLFFSINRNKKKKLHQYSLSEKHRQILHNKVWENWIYRAIFFFLAILFFGLGCAIFFKTVNAACSFYFKNSMLLKHCLDIFCILLGTISLLVAYKIHPKKEAFQYLEDNFNYSFSEPQFSNPIVIKIHPSLFHKNIEAQNQSRKITYQN